MGEQVANSDQVSSVIEQVSDAIGDKIPASLLASVVAGGSNEEDSGSKKDESGATDNSVNDVLV